VLREARFCPALEIKLIRCTVDERKSRTSTTTETFNQKALLETRRPHPPHDPDSSLTSCGI
jgi:hypothetical protein